MSSFSKSALFFRISTFSQIKTVANRTVEATPKPNAAQALKDAD